MICNRWNAFVGLIVALPLLSQAAVAQTGIESAESAGSAVSETDIQQTERRTELNSVEQISPMEAQAAPAAELSCPENYFASAFPDVTPDDWAYTAVNRLAARPQQCFPIVPRS